MKKAKWLVGILLLAILVVSVGCISEPETHSLVYYYDEVHGVCIWRGNVGGYGQTMFVLPADQVKNPELPLAP